MKLSGFFAVACLLASPGSLAAQSVPVAKTNPMKVYAHYMPWFQTPQTLGGTSWGWHWTMNNRNPNVILANGQRQIASNYYPLIGPYDSSDRNVIEYHMLLMKLSGIDGVILDWYGQRGTNGDINSLLSASNTIISKTSNYGMKFAVCLEDRFAGSTGDVTTNINYASQNYFGQSNYIRVGASNAPLMPIFGPVKYQQSSSWSTIMSGVPVQSQPALLPLWYQSQQVGSFAKGEYSWIYQDQGTSNHLMHQQNFLTLRSPTLGMAMGVAYPGFNDFYAQGGAGAGPGFTIPSNNGQTLASLLSLDATNASHMNMLELATFNDFGEGTMFEPTVQTGFSYLQQIQQFTGVSYGLADLQLVYQLYQARTQLAGNASAQTTLDQASVRINQLDLAGAHGSLAAALASAPSSIAAVIALTLNGAAGLDLTDKRLVINYSGSPDPIGSVRAYLITGRNGGAWNGLGINSSTAASNNAIAGNKIMALGYGEGGSSIGPSSILVRYTFSGDANLDGAVDTLDFNALAANFGSSGAAWMQGDFNYDGAVDTLDFNALAANFGASLPANPLAMTVPEPAILPFACGAALLLTSRISRSRLNRSAS
jgi:hypothetical protein